MENRRTHHFNDTIVITTLLPTGVYFAYRFDEDGTRLRGYGPSRFAAIADLAEQCAETAQ